MIDVLIALQVTCHRSASEVDCAGRLNRYGMRPVLKDWTLHLDTVQRQTHHLMGYETMYSPKHEALRVRVGGVAC